ncbi:MAG: tRNA pseudouridine(55) synthase TruB [Candidatus Dojkabacteria bacterium]|jgi:tRNA pseudouridine55 synthase
MIEGILLIDKEEGITSYDVIRKLKRVLPKGQKIGHAGTLDPFATGLLIILLGKSTKLMNNFLELRKEYEVRVEFGYSTDTQDITGRKTNISKDFKKISKEKIERMIGERFLGRILQLPPQYSAKKVKGKKAYEYAREGEKVDLKPKEIEIYEFDIINYDWPVVDFNVMCSSGTYVRTLANDLGLNLETFATPIKLRRIRIGEFNVSDSLSSADIVKGVKFNFLQWEND